MKVPTVNAVSEGGAFPVELAEVEQTLEQL
jgi:hypothetical protein